MAAELVTPAAVNFMARYARGLICLALSPDRVRALDLPLMPRRHCSEQSTAFTVSIEAKNGVSTGISAADRAHTIRVASSRSRISRRSRFTRAHLPGSRAQRWGAREEGAHRRGCRARYSRNRLACGGHLRNHPRRRDHGSARGSRRVLPCPRARAIDHRRHRPRPRRRAGARGEAGCRSRPDDRGGSIARGQNATGRSYQFQT